MASDAFHRVVLQINATSEQLVHEVGKANKSLGVLERTANRVSTVFQGILIGRGAFDIIQGIGNVITTLAEFDKAMVQVKVITGATDAQFKKLEASALSLGSKTQYTAKQVAELQLEFGRLGFSTKEILNATKATVDLATATGEGLARSAEIAGSTLRAFGLDSQEMTRVTDVMAASMNKSALTLDTFADGIKYVAPVAAASNITIEETAAMLSVLADAGIKGSQAGTSLRRIFTMLTKDGKPLQERLAELAKNGISLASANDEVGLYAQTALLVLGRMIPTINDLTKEFIAATGATNDMARAMENNLSTSITKVGTAWNALVLAIGRGTGIQQLVKQDIDFFAAFLRVLPTEKLAAIGNLAMGNLGAIALQSQQLEATAIILEHIEKNAKDAGASLDGIFKTRGIGVSAKSFLESTALEMQGMFAAINQLKIASQNPTVGDLDLWIGELEKLIKESNERGEIEKYQKRIEELNKTKNSLLGIASGKKKSNGGDAQMAGEEAISKGAEVGFFDHEVIYENVKALESLKAAQDGISASLLNMQIVQDQTNEKLATQRDMWHAIGEAAINNIDNVIARNKGLFKSIAELTARIVDASKTHIVAYLSEGAAKRWSEGNILAATAGLALISGLLKRISSSGGDSYVRTTPSYRSSSSSGQSSVNFVIRGENLYGVLNNYERNARQTSYSGG